MYQELDSDTRESDFPGILLKSTGNTATDNFVEVHIYEAFNRHAIELIRGEKPRQKADKIMFADLRKKLESDGLTIPFEEYE